MDSKGELARRILKFHERNFNKPETHQPIFNVKSSYFHYSRLFAIMKEIEQFDFENFIDIGCAEGMYLLAIKEVNPKCHVFGVDFSLTAIRRARQFTRKVQSGLVRADVAHLPFRKEVFDAVLCSETLEHVVDDSKAIRELARICKKFCLITVPSFHNVRSKSKFNPDIDCKRDSHLRKYSKDELSDVLNHCFKRVRIFNLSFWHLSNIDIILSSFVSKKISSKISRFLTVFAGFDYDLCKSGMPGHSFICICLKEKG